MVETVDKTGPPRFSPAPTRLNPRCSISFLSMDRSHSFFPPYPLPFLLRFRFRFSTLLPPIPNFLPPPNLSYSSFIVGDVAVSLFDRSNVLRVPLYVLPLGRYWGISTEGGLWTGVKDHMDAVSLFGMSMFSPRHYVIGHFLRSSLPEN